MSNIPNEKLLGYAKQKMKQTKPKWLQSQMNDNMAMMDGMNANPMMSLCWRAYEETA